MPPSTVKPATYTNPVYSSDFPDPGLIKRDASERFSIGYAECREPLGPCIDRSEAPAVPVARTGSVAGTAHLEGRHTHGPPAVDQAADVTACGLTAASEWLRRHGLRTTLTQLSSLFLKMSKPCGASVSGSSWVMIRIGSSSPRSMWPSSGLM
jgi:hypothetical protein